MKTETTTCNCISEIDKNLRDKNLRLSGYAFMMPDFTPVVSVTTEWVEKDKIPKGKTKRPTPLRASFCPFCGIEYLKSNP